MLPEASDADELLALPESDPASPCSLLKLLADSESIDIEAFSLPIIDDGADELLCDPLSLDLGDEDC